MPAPIAFALSRPYTPSFEAVSREIETLRRDQDSVFAVLALRSWPWRRRVVPGHMEAHPCEYLASPKAWRRIGSHALLHVFAPLPLPRRLRALRFAGPRMLTVIALDAATARKPHGIEGFGRIVTECARDLELLRRAGVPAARLRCIPPPAPSVELPLPDTPFTVGFASWPFEPDEAQARGLDLLRGAAAALPRVRFRILLRPGSRVPAHEFEALANVQLIDGVLEQPEAMWGEMHALLAPFRSGSKAKSVPNSILEALAAGRPVIVSTAIGIAAEIESAGAGLSIAPRLDDLCAAISGLQQELPRHSRAARRFAAAYSPENFRSAYAEVTRELLPR